MRNFENAIFTVENVENLCLNCEQKIFISIFAPLKSRYTAVKMFDKNKNKIRFSRIFSPEKLLKTCWKSVERLLKTQIIWHIFFSFNYVFDLTCAKFYGIICTNHGVFRGAKKFRFFLCDSFVIILWRGTFPYKRSHKNRVLLLYDLTQTQTNVRFSEPLFAEDPPWKLRKGGITWTHLKRYLRT